MWLHVPGVGADLESIRSPALVGVLIALAALLFAGAAFTRRRRLRGRARSAAAGAERPPAGRPAGPPGAPPHPSAVLGGGPGGGCSRFWCWRSPHSRAPRAPRPPRRSPYKQSGSLSYTGEATPGPTYPEDRVRRANRCSRASFTRAPPLRLPLPQHRAHTLAGTVPMGATVASTSGWQTRLALGGPQRFHGDRGTLDTDLDLASLQALVASVEKATDVGGGLHAHALAAGQRLGPPRRWARPHELLSRLPVLAERGRAAAGAGRRWGRRARRHRGVAVHLHELRHRDRAPRAAGRSRDRRDTRSVARARASGSSGSCSSPRWRRPSRCPAATAAPRRDTADPSRYGRMIVPVERVWQLPGVPVIDVADIDALVASPTTTNARYSRRPRARAMPSGSPTRVASSATHPGPPRRRAPAPPRRPPIRRRSGPRSTG